jgi:hypothetical protein
MYTATTKLDTNMAESYKIVIKGPNVSVDQEVSEEQAKRFLVALFSGKAAEASAQLNTTYITSSNAKSGPEKITAIGSFLKKHQATATFDKPTLEQGFSDAAEAVPKNMSRDIKMAIKSGWIAVKPGSPGTYYVTGGGQQAVAARFNDNPRRRAAKARNRRSKKGSV